MSERAAFLQAIRENSDDDAPRLAFANWLEERGDPLGEFIRVQCALGPIRDCDDERVEALRQREEQLLREYGDTWLGPLWGKAHGWDFHPVFRRGLVEVAALPVQKFLDHAGELTEWCPLLQEIMLYEARGRGADLADFPALGRYLHLRLFDWLTEEDARALAMSPHVSGLQTLEIWLGGEREEAVCRAFAASPVLTRLHELRLVQPLGGLKAQGQSEERSARADARAAEVDRLRGRSIARIARPFAQTFRLGDNSGRGLYAGRLPDDRQALVAQSWDGRLHVVLFDSRGHLCGVLNREPEWPVCVQEPESLPPNVNREELLEFLRGVLGREPNPPIPVQDDSSEQVLAYLRREFGFRPGFICVKEFATDEGLSVYHLPSHLAEIAENPDQPPDAETEEDRRAMRSLVSRWLIRGDFVIEWGNDYWAGPDGVIHSS